MYNEIVEFTFDDEKTGHGYYYLVNKTAVPGCEESNKRHLIESAKRYNEREIERVERKIAEKKEHLDRERQWMTKFWIEMEESDIRLMEMEIENRRDDIAECNEILGAAEAEGEKEEKNVNEVKFEIGSQHNRVGLYGGNSVIEVISRSENTVTLRESWVGEESGKLFHSEPKVYPVEVEKVGNVDVERVEIWEYRGSKGYICAASEEEQDSFREEAKKEAELADSEEATEAEEITEEELDEAIAEEVEKEVNAEMKVEEILEKVEQTKTRSAWDRGVKAYAEELVEELREAVEGGYVDESDLSNRRLFERAMLNGAADWKQYSEGGCSLCYDGQIAERLCAPWELRKTDNGRKDPNPRESWIDVQSRALYQAAQLVLRVAF